jgi:hypothetical protein
MFQTVNSCFRLCTQVVGLSEMMSPVGEIMSPKKGYKVLGGGSHLQSEVLEDLYKSDELFTL